MTRNRIFAQALIVVTFITVSFGTASAGEFFFGGGISNKYMIGNVSFSTPYNTSQQNVAWQASDAPRQSSYGAPNNMDGLFGWSGNLLIGLSPEIGYRFSRKFEVSLGTSFYLSKRANYTNASQSYDNPMDSRTSGGFGVRSVSLLAHWYAISNFFLTGGGTAITLDRGTIQSQTQTPDGPVDIVTREPGRAYGITVGIGHEKQLTPHTTFVGHYRYTYAKHSGDELGFGDLELDAGGVDVGFSFRYYPTSATVSDNNNANKRTTPAISNRLFFGLGYSGFTPDMRAFRNDNDIVSSMRLTCGWKVSNRTSVTVSYNRAFPKGVVGTYRVYESNSTNWLATDDGQAFADATPGLDDSKGLTATQEYNSQQDNRFTTSSWLATVEMKLVRGLFVKTGVDFISQTNETGTYKRSVSLTSLIGGLGYERPVSSQVGWVTSATYSVGLDGEFVNIVDTDGFSAQTQLRFYLK